MSISRRELLAGGGALLASCRAGVPATAEPPDALDRLLAAHADALPEVRGAGANHYPMAAEALAALGHEDAIEDSWRKGAAGYAGELPRLATIERPAQALGRSDRYGDWLDHFRGLLARESWREVVAQWAPRLAPGLSGALLHGLIRTAHAVRAMRHRPTLARRGELAVGLAYWAASYTELPTLADDGRNPRSLGEILAALEHPWLDDRTDVDFDAVMARLTAGPGAPSVSSATSSGVSSGVSAGTSAGTSVSDPMTELEVVVREAATAFLEMLALEQHRLWLLHGVTGPAAVGLLLPEVDATGGHRLVAYARQAVVAMYRAYGAPFAARAHVDTAPPPWSGLLEQAVASRSVHTIKLLEALVRFDRQDDPVYRSVAVHWLAWR